VIDLINPLRAGGTNLRGPDRSGFDQMWLISDTTAKILIIVALPLGLVTLVM
jgi:hypothetical protein